MIPGFIIQQTPSLITKVQQIIALRAVSNSENENYAFLLEKKLYMLDMFKSINHHENNLLASNPDESSASDTNGVMFHQGDSLSGTTIQMYT